MSECEIDRYGNKYWWVDGKLHRLDGPAIDYTDGYKAWWVDGKLHRLNGPAIERANGNKEWHVDGVELTEEEFNSHPKVCNYLFKLILEAELEK